MDNVKYYIYLITGQVYYDVANQDGTVSNTSKTLNSLLPLKENKIEVLTIDRMQHSLQMQLFNALGAQQDITDIVILNYNYIGQMTQNELQQIAQSGETHE